MYKSCNIPAFSSLDPSTARAGEGRGGEEVTLAPSFGRNPGHGGQVPGDKGGLGQRLHS